MKTNAKTKSVFKDAEKQKKKSKHGKKNWRKNIDISELEANINKAEQEKLIDKALDYVKDEDMFTIDINPMARGVNKVKKDGLLNKKIKRNKISKFEQVKIKRIAEKINKEDNNIEDKIREDVYNLWDDKNDNKEMKEVKKIQYPKLSFPKVPIPHPGQSYNPSREDLSKLLYKIVDLNKKVEPVTKTQSEIVEKKYYSDTDEDEEYEEVQPYIANNPAVDETQRLTRKEKKRKIQTKLNKVKQDELKRIKENRIKLANEKSLKTIEKQRKKVLTEVEKKMKEDLEKKKLKEELLLTGIIEEYIYYFNYNCLVKSC
jgi:nucleolar protein 53